MFQPGAFVQLSGVVGAPENNGRVGTIEQFDAENGRWVVAFDNGERRGVKPENLLQASAPGAQMAPAVQTYAAPAVQTYSAPPQAMPMQTYAAPQATYAAPSPTTYVSAPMSTYSAAPMSTYAAAPTSTYAAAPQYTTYAAAPATYASAPTTYTVQSSAGVDWEKVNAGLPYENTPEQKAKRNKLFRDIDQNGNGFVSLAEMDGGIQKVLQLPSVFAAKPAIIRAFNAAKNYGGDTQGFGPDYVDKREFRIFLQYLRSYFELFQMYEVIDLDSDHRLSQDEFCSMHEALTAFGVQCTQEELPDVFIQIDVDGGGMILFKEFADWAIAQKLDLGEEVNQPIEVDAPPAGYQTGA